MAAMVRKRSMRRNAGIHILWLVLGGAALTLPHRHYYGKPCEYLFSPSVASGNLDFPLFTGC
jgi:hypothetical protein